MTAPAVNTPNGVIADAMRDAGKLMIGQYPSSEQYAENLRRLCDIINELLTHGLKLWLNVDTSVTLVAGKATYTFKPSGDVDMTKPLRVIQGYYLDSSSVRRPLNVLSWNEYINLGQVTQQGPVNSYFVNKKDTEIDVTFWLVPDATAATGTAHVLLQTQATNPVSLTETINFPPEWRIALRWLLAFDICTGQPQAIMDRCEKMATYYRTQMENWDVEDAPTQIQPDARMTANYGKFK